MRSAFIVCFVAGAASSALASPYGHHYHRRQLVPTPDPTPVNSTREPVAATWFASWHAEDFPLSNVSWHKVSGESTWTRRQALIVFR